MNNTAYSLGTLDKDRLNKIIISLGLLVPIIMMAVIITVGQITPNYSPITNSISQMGAWVQPYSIILNSAYILYGILIITVAYILIKNLPHSTLVKVLLTLLMIHALGSICLALFPDKLDTPGVLVDNTIHNIFSAVSYVSLLLGILSYSIYALRQKTIRIIGIAGILVVVINFIMPMINLFSYLREIGGLLQRLLIFCSFSWIALTSAIMYKKTLSDQTATDTYVNKTTSFFANL
ncbi:MAG TPA: DUF998 domain-containing protein [Dehalococcoidia bacterium]|nr:DUF998 domain-containing protein [Dehalococcoidia bacterium]